MGFSIKGYVLEGPRVGSSNNPFTQTPSDTVSDAGAFSAAYPSDETAPRTDYMVMVIQDGKLPNATFGWTKNEGLVALGPAITRFDYDGKHQRFFPLPGGKPLTVGTLGANTNTSRLKVPVPIGVTPVAPFRLSIGLAGSGIAQNVSLVSTFGSPPAGTTELLTAPGPDLGKLNWNPADLVTFASQTVRFQQQSPFGFTASNGNIGLIGNNSLILNPIPGTTQSPLLRIGFDVYLTPIERPNEGSLSVNPVSGTVEWALTTGLLKFNSLDITNNIGVSIYYDGILMGMGLTCPVQNLGSVNLPGNTGPQPIVLNPIPPSGPFGGEIIFRVPGLIQFAQAVPTDTSKFDPVGKQGQVQFDPATGSVLLSLADRTSYGGLPLEMVSGDLPIDHGVSLRLFRTPIDLTGTDPTHLDVTAVYAVTGATLQSPITQVPLVFLPSIPLNSVTYTQRVYITQGTGSFPPSDLPNLAVPSPPPGIGFVFDFDKGQLQFASRQVNLLVPLTQATPIAVLPDPLIVTDAQRTFALETGPGTSIFTPFTESPPGSGIFTSISGIGGILDFTAGQFAFTQIAGQLLAQGSDASFNGTGLVFTDSSTNFSSDGVIAGDFLAVLTGTSIGVYSIVSVAGSSLTVDFPGTPNEGSLEYEVHHSKEVLADRFFAQVELVDPNTRVERIRALGTITNSPRFQIPASFNSVVRFRFGNATTGSFSTSTVIKPNDGAFTSPALLPQGTVEVSQATGNLNFSAVDVLAGGTVYWSRKLKQTTDYTITPELGNINFTDRFLSFEECLVTYSTLDAPTTVIVEPGTFIVRKELTQPHPLPVTTLSFNPSGRAVATIPPYRVWRGGRPQTLGKQCSVDPVASTITFLADTQLTDALPHGAVVKPNENVYVDYFIYQAIGGEKTLNVLKFPMNLAQVSTLNVDNTLSPGISAGKDNFVVVGDYSASFPAGFLLRIEKEQVYQIGSSTFSGATNLTTVTLVAGQKFTDAYTKPNLYVASGATRTLGTPLLPSYFQTETASYDAVARGMNVIKIVGDRTLSYRSGTILFFNNVDFYEATGAKYDAPSNRTIVTITRNVLQQYDTQVLKVSVRPVFEAATTIVTTTYNPVVTQPFLVWRRTEGQVGKILKSPKDYTIDQSGTVTVAVPLAPNEEISIFYTGHLMVQAGLRLQASYTNVIAPSATNGLVGQNLLMDYSTYSPDNFYFRVESMTNFRAEYADDLKSQTTQNAPTGGPMTSNSSQPQLFQQGRASLFFQEIHLANQDIVARTTLLFFNNAVNLLEDVLQQMDGRVVGDRDGRFLFDGNLNNPRRESFADVTNQIDDLVKVSDGPFLVFGDFFSGLTITAEGTYQNAYLPSSVSRTYPTLRRRFGATSPSGSGDNGSLQTGDPVLDTGVKKITSVNNMGRRSPWSVILQAAPAGSTTVVVDFAQGDTTVGPLRPAFKTEVKDGYGAKVQIQGQDGTVYVPNNSQLTIHGSTPSVAGQPGTITFSSPLTVDVPAGATIFESLADFSQDKPNDGQALLSIPPFNFPIPFYTAWTSPIQWRDYLWSPDDGTVTYVARAFPLDGFFDFPFQTQPLDASWWGEPPVVSYQVTYNNTDTAPDKFPALFGGTTDDDGEIQLPASGPLFNCEVTVTGGGYLANEETFIGTTIPLVAQIRANAALSSNSADTPFKASLVATSTMTANVLNPDSPVAVGAIKLVTTAPYVGTGSLDVTRTVITDSLSYSAPLPKVNDLVRILSGLNGHTSFHRISAVGANTVTVDTAFTTQDAGFQYTVTVSSTTITGTATLSGTTLTDSTAHYRSNGTKIGYTVVMTSGANLGHRRQIIGMPITNSQQLQLDSAFPSPLTGGTYRIDNPLDTFSGYQYQGLVSAVAQEIATLVTNPGSELNSLFDFFTQVFTDIITSVNGTVLISNLTELVDTSQDFIGPVPSSPIVKAGYYVYCPSGPEMGIYKITAVTDSHHLTIDPSVPFPSAATGISYQIVSAFGVTLPTLQDIFGILTNIETFVTSTQTFQTLLTTPVGVVILGSTDALAFARGYLTADFAARASVVTNRINYLKDPANGPIAKLENALSGTERLYDKRYVWIDARVDMKTGSLPQKSIAFITRLQAQADFLNQLIKLEAVEVTS